MKFLLILEEICNAQDRDVQDILQAAESNIKEVGKMSPMDIARLQCRLQGKPLSYAVVQNVSTMLITATVKKRRAAVEAAVKEAVAKSN